MKYPMSTAISDCREIAAVAPPVVACSVDCIRLFCKTISLEVKTETILNFFLDITDRVRDFSQKIRATEGALNPQVE